MAGQEHGYEHSPPFDSGLLQVSDIHKIHYEQYGKTNGKPVIFIHGGPGGSTSQASTVFFDPSQYRVVLYDQRGAGRSTPSGELRENTSQHLIDDIERLRSHLQIHKWHLVFGGSWGSCLSLLYAQAHPDVVGSLILRGISTGRKSERIWNRGDNGAARLYPDEYEKFLSPLPEAERNSPINAYYRLLTSDDVNESTKLEAARAFNRWDLTLSNLRPDYSKLSDDKWCLEHARIETHYYNSSNNSFVEEGQILQKENVDKIRHIPTTIVQGRYDIICPPRTAWDLHKAWPETRLFWVEAAGHGVKEPGVQNKLAEVCDEHARLEI